MREFLLCIFLLTGTGCSTTLTLVDKAADVNDSAVTAAQFTLCHGASVGSIRRAFGTPERAEVWKDLCLQESDFTPTEADR